MVLIKTALRNSAFLTKGLFPLPQLMKFSLPCIRKALGVTPGRSWSCTHKKNLYQVQEMIHQLVVWYLYMKEFSFRSDFHYLRREWHVRDDETFSRKWDLKRDVRVPASVFVWASLQEQVWRPELVNFLLHIMLCQILRVSLISFHEC